MSSILNELDRYLEENLSKTKTISASKSLTSSFSASSFLRPALSSIAISDVYAEDNEKEEEYSKMNELLLKLMQIRKKRIHITKEIMDFDIQNIEIEEEEEAVDEDEYEALLFGISSSDPQSAVGELYEEDDEGLSSFVIQHDKKIKSKFRSILFEFNKLNDDYSFSSSLKADSSVLVQERNKENNGLSFLSRKKDLSEKVFSDSTLHENVTSSVVVNVTPFKSRQEESEMMTPPRDPKTPQFDPFFS
jgi:hypothetical protein